MINSATNNSKNAQRNLAQAKQTPNLITTSKLGQKVKNLQNKHNGQPLTNSIFTSPSCFSGPNTASNKNQSVSQQSKYPIMRKNDEILAKQDQTDLGSQPPPHKTMHMNLVTNPSNIPNNFVPNSNLSTFLLKKVSSSSLQTFEQNDEYSYKINILNKPNQMSGNH